MRRTCPSELAGPGRMRGMWNRPGPKMQPGAQPRWDQPNPSWPVTYEWEKWSVGMLLTFQVVWYPAIADVYTIPPSSPSWKPTQGQGFWEEETSCEILSQETIHSLCESHYWCHSLHDSPLPESISVLVIIVISIHLGFYKQEVAATYKCLRMWRGWDYHVHFAKRK